MRRLVVLILCFFVCQIAVCQDFKTICEVPITAVKNQYNTATCWAFAGLSLLESEAIRKGAPQNIDLSERWILSHTYPYKAKKYVKLNGKLHFAQGGCLDEVLWVAKNYGLVSEEKMPDISLDDSYDILTDSLKNYLDTVIYTNAFSSNWSKISSEIIDGAVGERPRDLDAKEYLKSLKINAEDYISITSFCDYDYYKPFALELPDNWMWSLSYNLPLDELMHVVEYALKNAYSLGWAADISEQGFLDEGVAYMDVKNVSEQQRLDSFLSKATTDDHGMHIFGLAEDANGDKFYMVKNSWGDSGNYGGIWYFSQDYVRYKTIYFLLNKDALPKSLARKLGF